VLVAGLSLVHALVPPVRDGSLQIPIISADRWPTQVIEALHVLGYLSVAGLALLAGVFPSRRQWWALIPLLAFLATAMVGHLLRIEPLLGYLVPALKEGFGFVVLPKVATWGLEFPFLLGEALILLAAGFRTQRRLSAFWIGLVLLGMGLCLSSPYFFGWLFELLAGLHVSHFWSLEIGLDWLTSTFQAQLLSVAYCGAQTLLVLMAFSLLIRSEWAHYLGWAYLVAKMALSPAFFLLWSIVRPSGQELFWFLESRYPFASTMFGESDVVLGALNALAPDGPYSIWLLKVWLGLVALVAFGIALGQRDRPAVDG